MTRFYGYLLGIGLLVSPVWAQDPAGAAADPREEMLSVNTRFKDSWVHPDADFGRYDKLMFGEPEFEFRDVGPAAKSRSSIRSSSIKGEFGIAESEREKFKQVVSDAFRQEMERSKKFELVTTPGPDTILVQGAVLDIVSFVPPEMTGRSDVYMNSVGEATLILELVDSESGAVLAYVEDRRKMEKPGGGRIDSMTMPTNSVTVWSDVGRWARSAASRLRSSLEKAQKKARKGH
jgi:hypothetical protein